MSVLGVGCRGTRPDETIPCTPGEELRIGCAEEAELGSCSGDPTLRICDGNNTPDACENMVGQLGFDDDSGGSFCPLDTVTCPASGVLTVISRGFAGADFTCAWEVEPTGNVTPIDAGPDRDGGPGMEDAGADAGSADAGADAGSDAGPTEDAGPDSGPPDAGAPDSGAGPLDSGVSDGGGSSGSDGGAPPIDASPPPIDASS